MHFLNIGVNGNEFIETHPLAKREPKHPKGSSNMARVRHREGLQPNIEDFRWTTADNLKSLQHTMVSGVSRAIEFIKGLAGNDHTHSVKIGSPAVQAETVLYPAKEEAIA